MLLDTLTGFDHPDPVNTLCTSGSAVTQKPAEAGSIGWMPDHVAARSRPLDWHPILHARQVLPRVMIVHGRRT